ncbi:P-loop ATPase, Sll1717 family [Marinomonas pollencensis]|uniref:DNA repair protein n=1 Tax=Marinomonas pollencensis TaxID=491954 RepID=A0A3E0DM37_9GAMM|nr:DNA repair protein [Marinomonas pollencensis]REG83753.1 hypothetical protein DFP81_105119 [Marinomonas pollencensis]
MTPYKFRSDDTIGNLDAESDSFLSSCFLESNVYKILANFENNMDFTKRIIVGRTGSGKTALLKQIKEDHRIKKTNEIEAESTVFEHIKNNVFISQLTDEKIDLRVFYKSLWVHVLLTKIIETIDTDRFMDLLKKPLSTIKKRYNIELAKDYIESFSNGFFNDNIISEMTDRMQNDLKASFSISGIGISGGTSSDTSQKIQRETSRYVSSELLKKQKEIIKIIEDEFSNEHQIKIVISIDDLDKSWLSSSEIRYDFINALLDAFKELVNVKSVKILISIRTDIMMGIYKNNLRQEEKDKAFILPIKWSRQEISEILDKRINHLIKHRYQSKSDVSFSDVFSFPIKNTTVDNYILDRTMLRPRDAIDFINICLSNSDGLNEMDENLVLRSEEEFYTSRKQALVKEWISLYPHIKDYIDGISFLLNSNFTILENKNTFEKIEEFLISKSKDNEGIEHNKIVTNPFDLINIWFMIGIVGIKKSDSLIIYSSFDKQELDITDQTKNFIIHPLFFRE